MISNCLKKEITALQKELLEKGIPPEAELIYNGRNKLYKLTLPSGLTVNIKAFRRLGIIRGMVYALFSAPKSVKSFRNSERLIELGFRVPLPYGHVEEREWGGMRLGRSYYISEQLEDFEETRCWENWPDKEDFCEALGAEMAKLYRQGVLFRDFSPGNVLLVSRKPYRFAYVDVNRTDFGVKSRRRMMTMFKRINIVPDETARLARAMARSMGWEQDATEKEALGILRRFLWWKDDFMKPIKRMFRR